MKRLKNSLLLISLIFTVIAIAQTNNTADYILGNWFTGNKGAKITIFKIGSMYYGKISWLKNPNNEQGKPKTDEHNPDETLRSRNIMGLLLLKRFEFDAAEQIWTNGEIYDPKNGKSYSCKLKLIDRNTLDVHGYIGFSLLGRSDTWTRSE